MRFVFFDLKIINEFALVYITALIVPQLTKKYFLEEFANSKFDFVRQKIDE